MSKRYKVKFIPAAHNDLKEARAWYRQQNPALPKRFMEQVKKTVKQLATLPVTHAVRYKDVRIAQVDVFPYTVHYLIENNTITVIAVHHSAIDPDKWLKRR
jgi:plasmid stabilization system protein ParE